MKFKPLHFLFAIINVVVIIACNNYNSRFSDSAIKADAEKAFKDDPMAAGIRINVKDGIVTISGECTNRKSKHRLSERMETVPGVRSVINNCTLKFEPGPAANDEELNIQLWDLASDYPTIRVEAMEGIVSIVGKLEKKDWTTIKEYIDKLAPKGYDTTSLRIE